MNYVIGYHSTKFGELWEISLFDLIKEAFVGLTSSTNIKKDEIDVVFFGNMLGGILDNQLLSSGYICEVLGLQGVPIYRTEGACASGGLAFNLAHEYLKANKNCTALVLGAEKMTDFDTGLISKSLASASSTDEKAVGLTFPAVYALMAKSYMEKYKCTEEDLAQISIKNHYHGTFNKNAHFRREISLTDVMESQYVAEPLKVLDSSPISDGASAVLLTNKKDIVKKGKAIEVLSSQIATDVISLAKRETLTGLPATRRASKKAFEEARIKRSDINVAEVHDCFSIAEIMAMEDIGFWSEGEGGQIANLMETKLDETKNNKLVVNTSGGLKASGYPVGATGIKQIGEVYLQLTGQAYDRQVKGAHKGLTHNVGGSGGVCVINIFSTFL